MKYKIYIYIYITITNVQKYIKSVFSTFEFINYFVLIIYVLQWNFYNSYCYFSDINSSIILGIILLMLYGLIILL